MEKFDIKKAKEVFNITDLVQWVKTFAITFRVLILAGIILGIVYGVGYYQAIKKRPVVPLNIEQYLKEGKSVRIKLDGDYFEIDPKEGMRVTDANGKIKKIIKVEDIPVLDEAFNPIAWEKPNLIGIYGLGFGSTAQTEYGAGIDMVRLWKAHLGVILTNSGAYLEANYPIKRIGFINLNNTSLLGGTGYSYKGERQHIIGLKLRF